MKTNIAMRYENAGEGKFKVSGRGELQITILAENMRREGFEFCLGRPEVIIKEIDGIKCEPFEHLVIDAPDDCTGTVIEKLGRKKAEMKVMNPTGDGQTRMEFEIPARGLIGFRSQFLTDTRGEGVMNHSFWNSALHRRGREATKRRAREHGKRSGARVQPVEPARSRRAFYRSAGEGLSGYDHRRAQPPERSGRQSDQG